MVLPRHFDGRMERDSVARIRIGDHMAAAETPTNAPISGWPPGDPRPDLPSMLRVDQAGEYGATRIYAGQLAVMGDRHPAARATAGMASQEEVHRKRFDAMI